MEEIFFGNLLKNFSLIAGVIGILVGLDLVLGARITRVINRASTKFIDFDKSINNPGIRIGLGIIFLIISLLMLLLIKKSYTL